MYTALKNRVIYLLRWSEQYTRLDMVYVASGSFWQTFGQVASNLLALGLMLVLANALPKETYGTYRYLLSLAGLLNIFTLTEMNQAVSRAVARGEEGALRSAVRYQLKWNALMMLAFLTLGLYYLSRENFAYTGALLVLGLAIPFTAAFNTYVAYLGGKRQFMLGSLFSVLATALYVAGMIVAVYVSGAVFWLIVVYAVTTLVASLTFYLITLWLFRPPLAPSPDTLTYGRRLSYTGFMSPIASQLDSIILSHFWGPASLAVYSVAMSIPSRSIPFVKGWVSIGLPKMAAKTREELDRSFYLRLAQGLALGLLMALAYALAAPYLFHYLLPQYTDAIFFTQLLGLSFVFALPNRYLSMLFVSQQMPGRVFVSQFTQNVIRIASYVVLGIWGGILGLVVAQVANSALGLLINILVWRSRRLFFAQEAS
jgi:O-antigen/teichoic acid export membrane protein